MNIISRKLDDWRAERIRRQPIPCSCGKPIVGGPLMYIDPQTLRRRYRSMCPDCHYELTNSPQQKRLREERTRKDWSEITTPVKPTAIVPNQMPEQYPGRVREALRAFVASDASRAVVPGIDMASLQEAIGTLGLHSQVYAEQRDNQTVLRRIGGKS